MAILTPEQVQAFARKRLGIESEADVSRRRLGEDYTQTADLLAQDRDTGIKDTGHQIASQGLYNSGIRIDAQGQIVQNFNQNMSELNLSKTRGLEDVERNLSKGLADLDYQQAAALAEANRQEQAQNDARAQMEAIRAAAAVSPPAYPNPVIQMSQPAPVQRPNPASPVQAIPQAILRSLVPGQPTLLPQYRPPARGGSYSNWPAFVQGNPDLAQFLLAMNNGDERSALDKAQADGYIMRTSSRPTSGGRF